MTMRDYLIAAGLAALMTLFCLPGLLHSAKQYCDLGYRICVNR
jgi:hypothetical protein